MTRELTHRCINVEYELLTDGDTGETRKVLRLCGGRIDRRLARWRAPYCTRCWAKPVNERGRIARPPGMMVTIDDYTMELGRFQNITPLTPLAQAVLDSMVAGAIRDIESAVANNRSLFLHTETITPAELRKRFPCANDPERSP